MGWFSAKPSGLKSIVAREDAEEIEAILSTSRGEITVLLAHKKARLTCQNFIDLAEQGFYDGLLIHRVIEDFMVQTGCPNGDGRGDAGYQFADEFCWGLNHNREGTLSMANSGPHTNSSQFFLTLGPCRHLNRKHSVFGHVIAGMAVLKDIGACATDGSDRPREPITLTTVQIVRR